MRAIICSEYGPAEALTQGEMDSPAIGTDDIRIRVYGAAVNFPDNLIIQGKYQAKPPMPFAPGFEIAGEVIEVGANVNALHPGDRVMALTRDGYGGFAEEAVARAELVVKVPEGMDCVTASGFYSAYGTSYYALVRRGRIQANETLVVLGAAGGVGLASIEIAKALGATVIAVASSTHKLEAAKAHGADHLIDYSNEDLKKRVLELTDGRGADMCMDTVGGEAFNSMSRCMSHGGRLLIVGFASGQIPQIPANLLLLKNIQVAGIFWWPAVQLDPAQHHASFRHLSELYRAGSLRPLISRTYPLERTPDALKMALSRNLIGKLVITPTTEPSN
ncbi:NADPH:quinone oxidoreductase [Pseudomonas taiwanensis]|uniref:NADPH:quinone oxidoreductase family protein n=1 Tax=Pseudomonas TaxID=286 RepID=UPI0015BAACA1|nr:MULTISPECIES: NADPH:quinone oxidoreductase family protein [Pseudomonas]MDH4560776.1 NADPH:quinone oxidoreductase family protein [Pseudomonas sp. BN411]MDH4653728.1 NADPH:quinone oxidoreductase family protein [Pseudomonas sp. BN606]MDH4874125.1 NADPH:quinone oxidoreductase family protein [Pseudomonas sp. BN515]NWL75757.1 NADPH:quinone oxidoreductase [Pseudomonas taiwanensis]